MTTARAIPSGFQHTITARSVPSLPTLPAWVGRLVGSQEATAASLERVEEGLGLSVTDGGHAALIRATIDNATSLGEHALRDAARSAYAAIADRLASLPARHAVRFWNFIPDLHGPLGRGTDRYMVFNAGRHDALLGGPNGNAERAIPTATGIGHTGPDLLIACLGLTEPGVPIENPRQVPAYRYSARYGPRPPCFSRATAIRFSGEGSEHLLVGGTASVVGEDSRHNDNLERQFNETRENLGALAEAWNPALAGGAWIRGLREVRVYAPTRPDRLGALVHERLPGPARVEFIRADLCRRELLVEIEAVIAAPPPTPSPGDR